MSDTIWLLILAAGKSSRMGTAKQFLPIHGNTMIRHVTKKALLVDHVKVGVVGNAEPLLKEQCVDLPISWVENMDAYQGLSSSIRVGVQFAIANCASAVIITLGDQPDIEPKVVDELVEAYRKAPSTITILQTKYTDGIGHPVLFDQSIFPELLRLEGDSGAKHFIQSNKASVQFIEVPYEQPKDIDTPEEYQDFLKK